MVQYPSFSFPRVYLLPSGYGWVLAFHCRTLPLKQLGESNISPTLWRDPKRKQRHHFEGFEHSVRQWLPNKILVFQFFWKKNVKWVDSLLVGRNQRSEMINSDSQIWKKNLQVQLESLSAPRWYDQLDIEYPCPWRMKHNSFGYSTFPPNMKCTESIRIIKQPHISICYRFLMFLSIWWVL